MLELSYENLFNTTFEKMNKLYIISKRICFGLVVMLFTLFSNSAYAQNTITGTVVSADDNQPIIGAAVIVVGTQRGTSTDIDGNFKLNVPKQGNIEVSYIGFRTEGITLQSDKTNYKISLVSESESIDEVVVVGYGTMRKKETTGAVARISGDEISKMATSDLATALQGQIAGVNVQSAGGAPGSQANITIRGINSISGGNSPLFVVDGVPYEGDPGISDNEIASIDVLKDAASAAIYGTRGAGGVILITTKEGKKGEMKISFDGYYGAQVITSTIDLMEASERNYVDLLEKMRENSSLTTFDEAWMSIKSYQSSSFNNSNLMDVVQKYNAPIQNYSLTVSGGSNDLTYNIVGGYFNQDGVIINSDYERYNLRANTNFKHKKWTFGAIVSFKMENQTIPGWGLMTEAYKYNPMQTLVDPNADVSGNATGDESTITNMTYILARLKEDHTKNTDAFNANIQASYDIIKGLKFNTRLGVNYSNIGEKTVNPLFLVYDTDGELKANSTRSSVQENSARGTSLTWESMLNWNRRYGKHNLSATGVYSMELYTHEMFYAKVFDLITTGVPSLSAGTSDMFIGKGAGQWGQDRTTAMIGMLARAQYSYDDRYMISASVRRDGSSKFAKENRWGVFPSISTGWNVSEEHFCDDIRDVLTNLKLRASFGTTGNSSFADYAYQTVLATHYDYSFGTQTAGGVVHAPGLAQDIYSNPNVKWETTQQINFGLDFGFFNNKLTGSFDIYESNKRDMLFPLLVPATAGVGTGSTVTLNVGDMQNRGCEFALNYRGKVSDFGYNISTTFSTNENTVIAMNANTNMFYFADGSPTSGTDLVTTIKEGYPASSFFVMETNGVVNTEQKLAEYQKIEPNAKMGDLIYVDQTGDNDINDDDRVYAGNGAPEYEVGFNTSFTYKGFDLSMNWYSSIGNEIINGSKVFTYQNKSNRDLVYQWSAQNPTSNIPSYESITHDNYRSYSDIWVEDGSFLRLKNVMLGYSLPQSVVSKAGLTKCRFYVAADNLLTFTKYTGYDPEVGNTSLARRGLDLGTYPISMQVRGGVQINF